MNGTKANAELCHELGVLGSQLGGTVQLAVGLRGVLRLLCRRRGACFAFFSLSEVLLSHVEFLEEKVGELRGMRCCLGEVDGEVPGDAGFVGGLWDVGRYVDETVQIATGLRCVLMEEEGCFGYCCLAGVVESRVEALQRGVVELQRAMPCCDSVREGGDEL